MKIKRYLILIFGLIACLSVSVFGASPVCVNCGTEMTLVQHKSSTCKTPGFDVYECAFSWCGYRETVTLPLASHNYLESKYLAPTCKDSGYIEFRCSVCKNTYRNTVVPDSSLHEWELQYSALSTCIEEGYEHFECSYCGEQKQETLPIDVDAHSLLPVLTEPQTCVNDGYFREKCGLCNHIVDTPIPADGTSHNFVYIENRTDGSVSYEYYVCSFCDGELFKEIPIIHEHHYSEFNRIDPTPDMSGTVEYICDCGAIRYENLDYVSPIPETTVSIASVVFKNVWRYFQIYVPGFNFTFGQLTIGVFLCANSVAIIKFLLNMGSSGNQSRTSSSRKPKIADNRKDDEY